MQTNVSGKGQFSSYDDVFLERYDSVLRWASQITKYDRELAEDLVHEVYVQFTVTRQNPAAVNSIDNYLYVALRNAYISYLRRTVRQGANHLSFIDYDSVDNALLAVDPRLQSEIHDKLRAVCRYACLRKETSISGSILILRFFHGYFPSEVAQILNNSNTNVVEVRLLAARREATAFLINPQSFLCKAQHQTIFRTKVNYVQRYQDLLNDLRQEIFSWRHADCFHPKHLEQMYGSNESRIGRNVLKHIVSCPKCLDEVNKILGLALLHERHPLDTLGRETFEFRNEKNQAKALVTAASG